ncbi:hypothetical protein AB1K54_05350 [Microbacterium sp. BWT-B31]|uniref:hypothetical protein n=1 Tax=Microbacterium sp. BWT-B31 TaxID=3232072 RepID=UPI003527DB7B
MTKPLKITTGLLAIAALATSGSAIAAAAEPPDDDGKVEVTVEIAQIDQPGVLAMTVAGGSVALAENGSDPLRRRFTGALPSVTVTDTRSLDEIRPGASWYVLGTASDFIGATGQAPIPAANLGWTPKLVDYSGSGEAFAGEPVRGALDGGSGLTTSELLASTLDSASVNAEGSWTASADLALSTAPDVAPGVYASTITLSLFE